FISTSTAQPTVHLNDTTNSQYQCRTEQ
ncbi:unnamed protein product, partial [Rotaria sp. Silwood2]